jgi:TPR repeat protein
MSRLGYMYSKGRGVQQDFTEAFRWYMKGAEAGNAQSMHNLGYLYYEGRGVRNDYEQARRWIEGTTVLRRT